MIGVNQVSLLMHVDIALPVRGCEVILHGVRGEQAFLEL